MADSKYSKPRRDFIRHASSALVFVPPAFFLSRVIASETALVDPESPKAVGLSYIAKTETEGQQCDNCALYQAGDDAAAGGCPLFQDAKVGAEAWCSAWVAKG